MASDHDYLASQSALGPIVRNHLGFLNTFSHENLQTILTDPAFRHIELDLLRYGEIQDGPVFETLKHSLLFANQPDHRRRRLPLARALSQSMTDELEHVIHNNAVSCTRDLRALSNADFVKAFAEPYLDRVMCAVMGLSGAEAKVFKTQMSKTPITTLYTPDLMRRNAADVAQLRTWIAETVCARNAPLSDGVLKSYLRECAVHDVNPDEIVAQIVTLMLASFDTTRTALAICVALLLSHPRQWNVLQQDPKAFAASAMAECMRFEPVVASLIRVVERETVLDGYRLPQGSVIIPYLISAQRDIKVYASPNDLNILRDDHPRRHLGFGGGSHRCIGETLAELTIKAALIALAEHCPDLTMTGPVPAIHGLNTIRTVETFQVSA